MTTLANALRHAALRMQRAIDQGHRSRRIDADDLVEVLLAVADELDPPLRRDPPAGPDVPQRG